MSTKPIAGLTLHSDFAKKYAARRDPLAHIAATGQKLDHALSLQAQHWGAIGAHLYGNRGSEEY